MKTNLLFSLLFTLFLSTSNLFAHPHMFVSVMMNYEVDSTGLKSVDMVWHIDKMNSLQIIDAYDLDSSGVFEKKELISMLSIFKPNLLRMVQTESNGAKKQIETVEKFRAIITKDQDVLFSFKAPLEYALNTGEEKKIVTTVYDTENFIAFSFKHDKVGSRGDEQVKRSLAFSTDYDKEVVTFTMSKDI